MALNAALKMAIIESGKSQELIAQRCGIHYSTVSRIVRGWYVPDDEQKKAIAKELKRPVHDLFPEPAVTR